MNLHYVESILEVLHEDEKEKFREELISLLLRQVQTDMDASGYYCVNGKLIQDFIEETIEEKLGYIIDDLLEEKRVEIENHIMAGFGIPGYKEDK